jgi:hypothetical protein
MYQQSDSLCIDFFLNCVLNKESFRSLPQTRFGVKPGMTALLSKGDQETDRATSKKNTRRKKNFKNQHGT